MPQFKTTHITFAPPATVTALRAFLDQWKDSPQLAPLREVMEVASPWFQVNLQNHRGIRRPTLVLQGLAAVLLQDAITSRAIPFPFPVVAIRRRHYYHRIDKGPWWYSIDRYMPFDPAQTRADLHIHGEAAWRAALKTSLEDHIEHYMIALGMPLQQEADVQSLVIRRRTLHRHRGLPYRCFDLSFAVNVFIPERMNVGSSAGAGAGMVRRRVAPVPL
jgi:hypothetical protein